MNFREQAREWVEPWRPRSVSREPRPWSVGASHQRFPTLEAVGEDLVAQARELPALIGPEGLGELARMSRHSPPGSAVLVGPSGAGKTARIHELARRLERRARTTDESIPRLWATDADRIVAGMSYLGQWEKRCLKIIEELRHEGHWLYVGRLEDFIAPRTGGTSIAEMFAASIQDGSISVLTECTPEALERCRRQAPSLSARLRPVRVPATQASRVPELVERYVDQGPRPRGSSPGSRPG